MRIKSIDENEKEIYDSAVSHPLQSFAWGEFKKAMGQNVERICLFDGNADEPASAFQISFHKIPFAGGTVGYLPKGRMADTEQIKALKEIAKKQKAVFIKLEPNVYADAGSADDVFSGEKKFLLRNGAVLGKNLFTEYNFHLDLTPSLDDLFAGFKSKTRYNTRLAEKKGVKIIEESTESGMETYIRLMLETTSRQKFFSHTPEYYRIMWNVIGKQENSMMRIFHAMYQDKALVSWIIFLFNGKLYYPYGASSDECREVMASNLMMWEMIKYGHEKSCTCFDLWGSLGPEPDCKDPWYGFHRFKEGYSPALARNIGTFDLVYKNFMYKSFNLADKLRWFILRRLRR
ncbi:MAG: peptidoglycan bridge formation glycyltransferase FemA/FemB family protein [Treponema sp.]|nr:peptidoglycan bridge formation glycyltransferase FemA/FemB family protein [Treponema sp.]